MVGKLATAAAAWDGDQGWVRAAVVLKSLLSLFYYLRWLVPVFGLGPSAGPAVVARTAYGRSAGSAVAIAALLSLLFGVGGGWLWSA